MSKKLRRAAESVLRQYDAYCGFWDDDGNAVYARQVAWSSLDTLRAALVADNARRSARSEVAARKT